MIILDLLAYSLRVCFGGWHILWHRKVTVLDAWIAIKQNIDKRQPIEQTYRCVQNDVKRIAK